MIQFTDPEVAAKYTTEQTADKIHHLPGGKGKNGWKGLLSNIPIAQADRWINRPGQNLLKLKEVTPVVKPDKKKNDLAENN